MQKRHSDKHLKITSQLSSEFETVIVIGDDKYIVQTEDTGENTHEVVTMTYRKGEIISTTKTDYSNILHDPDIKKRLLSLMQIQHKSAVRSLKEETVTAIKTVAEYLEDLKVLLRRKNQKAGIHMLTEAIENHPDDPFLLSYYGCLKAIVEKDYTEGINICKRAIERLNATVPFGEEFFYPSFYLNLGRAYLAAGLKKDALSAFHKGLKPNGENPDLLWEIKKLGMRKKPPISFLPRSNPLNKYIGLLLSKLQRG